MKTISVNAFLDYTSILTYQHNFSNKGQTGPFRDTGFPEDPRERAEKIHERDEFEQRLQIAQDTKPMRKAKVSYYLESKNLKEVDEQYKKMGYVNLNEKATIRGHSVQQELSKASFYRNRHTNIIIFVLDTLYPSTWGAIYNAVVNDKTVLVRHGRHSFRDVKLGSDDFNHLSSIFQDAKVERGIAYSSKSTQSTQEERLKQFKIHDTTVTKLALADVLAPLWELEPAQNYYEYQLLMETINTYISAQFTTEEIFVGDLEEEDNEFNLRGRELVRNLATLPMNLRKLLQPLLNIKETTVESFGNEDLMDATLLGTV